MKERSERRINVQCPSDGDRTDYAPQMVRSSCEDARQSFLLDIMLWSLWDVLFDALRGSRTMEDTRWDTSGASS